MTAPCVTAIAASDHSWLFCAQTVMIGYAGSPSIFWRSLGHGRSARRTATSSRRTHFPTRRDQLACGTTSGAEFIFMQPEAPAPSMANHRRRTRVATHTSITWATGWTRMAASTLFMRPCHTNATRWRCSGTRTRCNPMDVTPWNSRATGSCCSMMHMTEAGRFT